ncbi:uncharacterized protein LOC127832259 isoform X2 [Dreissena polymorpha]|uniref:Uncharacterized protein n=1 Tax=Dreissena polymorpha TaxID=45954 RepID=A0A9D4JQQ2_DREPO|nr:uncharacterized protein LOC127832259 isoform X2 [Dreissena polymorpha]KAH3816487.1 hypothetical protein DPMN_118003 [Dreissena polymorpha]
MTTVSLIECRSPVSLRSCGSSVGNLKNRRRLQQCLSHEKRASAFRKLGGADSRTSGIFSCPENLGGVLVASPIHSPIPRPLPSPYGRNRSLPTDNKSPENSEDEFSEYDLAGHFTESRDHISLAVVGSKPHLRGMWEVPEVKANTTSPTKRNTFLPIIAAFNSNDADQITSAETRYRERPESATPGNPPPSPINFMDGFVVGGQKMSYTERPVDTKVHKGRDFKPGFTRPPVHCEKCEGKMMDLEQSQIVLNRRMSKIINMKRAVSRLHGNASAYSGFRSFVSGNVTSNYDLLVDRKYDTQRKWCQTAKTFVELEINAEKRRLKQERERFQAFKRERRREIRHYEELMRLREKIARKEARSQLILRHIRSRMPFINNDTRRPFLSKSANKGTKESAIDSYYDDFLGRSEYFADDTEDSHFVGQYTNQQLSPLFIAKSKSENTMKTRHRTDQYANIKADDVFGGNEHNELRLCWSDIWPLSDLLFSDADSPCFQSKDVEAIPLRNNYKRGSSPYLSLLCNSRKYSIHDSAQNRHCVGDTTPSNSTAVAVNTEVEAVQESSTDDSGRKDVMFTSGDNSQEESTMSSTLIIPDRTIPCSQWVSFTGDNEPVLNSAPEVDESSDTFLKRLQRSKLESPNDSCMPSGHEFCFEAVVDKRYNRWKRRRRKKNSKRQQPVIVPGSGSSDENDERNAVIERIIDTMYEQIHGPVPHTPNGSSDTPRTRNRRRREKESSINLVSGDDCDVDPSSGNYDASSSSSSTEALRVTYDKTRHIADGSSYTTDTTECTPLEVYSPQVSRVRPEASDSGATSEDMCAWSHIEQYKQEILRRLEYTPSDQLDQKTWLPDLANNYDDEADDNDIDDNDNDDGEEYDNCEFDDDYDKLVDDGCIEDEANCDDEDIVYETETFTGTQQEDIVISMAVSPKPEASRSRQIYADVVTSQPPDSITQHKTDPSQQKNSYSKWSRKNTSKPKNSTADTPVQVISTPSLVRGSQVSWGEIETHPKRQPPFVHTSKDSQRQKQNSFKQKQSLSSSGGVKRSKEPYSTKKQNINLPSLGKNAKSQTMPFVINKKNNRPHKQDRVTKSSDLSSLKDLSIRPTPPARERKPQGARGSEVKVTATVRDFLFRDYYLRQLYGNKSYKNDYVQFL